MQRREQTAQDALNTALAELGGGPTIERHVLFGTDPADVILDTTRREVDLLVLGSRAYGPVRRALLGSVSNRVVRHASCPVVVTPRVDESAG